MRWKKSKEGTSRPLPQNSLLTVARPSACCDSHEVLLPSCLSRWVFWTPGPRRPRCRSPFPSGGPGSWRTAAARYARGGSRRRGTSSSHCQSTPLTARKKGAGTRTSITTTTRTTPSHTTAVVVVTPTSTPSEDNDHR